VGEGVGEGVEELSCLCVFWYHEHCIAGILLLRLGSWIDDVCTMLGGQKSLFSSAIVIADAGLKRTGCIPFLGPVPGEYRYEASLRISPLSLQGLDMVA